MSNSNGEPSITNKSNFIVSPFNNNNNNAKSAIESVTRTDLLTFKEEVLKMVRVFQKDLKSTLEENKLEISEKISKNEEVFLALQKESSKYMSKLDYLEEKNDTLEKMGKIKKELDDKIMVNGIQIQSNSKDLISSCFKYDKMILDNLIVPGLIGTGCRFNNLKDYLVFNKNEMSQLSLKSQQSSMDLKSYKTKIDSLLSEFRIQLQSLLRGAEIFAEKKVAESENRMNSEFVLVYDKIKEVQISNSTYAKSLAEQENIMIKRNKDIERIQKEIDESNKICMEYTRKMDESVVRYLKETREEFRNFKKIVIDLNNLLLGKSKNQSDKANILTNFNKMVFQFTKEAEDEKNVKINFPNKKKYSEKNLITKKIDAESYIKSYIQGNTIFWPLRETPQVPVSHLMGSKKKIRRVQTQKLGILSTLKLKKINENEEKDTIQENSQYLETREKRGYSQKVKNFDNLEKLENNNKYKVFEKSLKLERRGNSEKFRIFDNIKNSERNEKSEISENSRNYDNNGGFEKFRSSEKFLKSEKIKKFDSSGKFGIIEKFGNIDKLENFRKSEKFENYEIIEKPKNKKILFRKQMSMKAITFGREGDKNFIKQKEISEENSPEITKESFNTIHHTTKSILRNSLKMIAKPNIISSTYDDSKINKDINELDNIFNSVSKESDKSSEEEVNNNNSSNINKSNNNISINNSKYNDNNKNINSKNNSKNINNNNKKKDINININSNKNNNNTENNISNNIKRNIINKSININKMNNTNYNNTNNTNSSNTNINIIKSKNHIKDRNISNRKNILNLPPPLLSLSVGRNIKVMKMSGQGKEVNNSNINYHSDNEISIDKSGEVYFNKNILRDLMYIKDQDIISTPLVPNEQRVDIAASPGTLEEKITILEFFVKRKLDELAREVRSFVPIRFNAWVKGFRVGNKKGGGKEIIVE